ncbi:hypothetical protein ATE84_0368 [Aquimarina sp. MAR_2010_214]|nr:hypothetical protein [Aquimarina sp. MAR_2010_214]PKV48370.1 hypothetical protein ATE84_0368 [Aquimarina sp. MAR_2010_214]
MKLVIVTAVETFQNEVLKLFIKAFNQNLETNTPIKAVVVPVEKHV